MKLRKYRSMKVLMTIIVKFVITSVKHKRERPAI